MYMRLKEIRQDTKTMALNSADSKLSAVVGLDTLTAPAASSLSCSMTEREASLSFVEVEHQPFVFARRR